MLMHNLHSGLKQLLSITQAEYARFYAPLYSSLENWITQHISTLSLEIKAIRLQTIWRYGVDALKIRRGYLLPFGSDAETCYREQEVWSYAVFTAALLDSMMKHFNPNAADLIEAMLPAPGLAWLKAYSTVFEAWNQYIKRQDNTTPFYTIERQLEKSRKRAMPADNTTSAETTT